MQLLRLLLWGHAGFSRRNAHAGVFGYVAVCSGEACVGCGKCAGVCPFGVIAMKAGPDGQPTPVIDSGLCMGCGVCALRCRKEALSLALDPAKPEPLWVRPSDHDMAETG